MRISNKSYKSLEKALEKQAPPGPPPRPGLKWNPSTRRWIRDPKQSMFTATQELKDKYPDDKFLQDRPTPQNWAKNAVKTSFKESVKVPKQMQGDFDAFKRHALNEMVDEVGRKEAISAWKSIGESDWVDQYANAIDTNNWDTKRTKAIRWNPPSYSTSSKKPKGAHPHWPFQER